MPTTQFRRPLGITAAGLAIVLIAALFVLTTPWHPETAYGLTAAPSGKDPTKFGHKVLRIVNKKRAHHNAPKLRMQKCDLHYATNWGNKLAADDAWYHSNLYKLLSKCNMYGAAENLVMFPDGMTPRQVVKIWMHSSGHRQNLLNRQYHLSGVYFVWDPDQAMWYGVQEFSNR